MLTILIIILCPFIYAETLYYSVTFYDGLGQKFRQESVSAWPNCVEDKRAQKIFLDKTNELREIAIFDKTKVRGAGTKDAHKFLPEVNALFAKALPQSKNPCTKIETPKEEAKDKFEMIEVGGEAPLNEVKKKEEAILKEDQPKPDGPLN